MLRRASSPTTCRAAACSRVCPAARSCSALALDAVPLPRRQAAQRRGQDLRLHRAGGELRPAARLHRHRLLRPHHVLRHRRLRRRDRARRAWGRPGARSRIGVAAALALSARAGARHRPVLAAGAGDLLRHDHAGGRLGLAGPGLAALGHHRRRGRPARSSCPSCCARHSGCSPSAVLGVVDQRPARSPTTSSSSSALLLFLLLLRIVNSPFGRVLQAIRENEFRAEALGYRTVVYRTAANCHLGAGRDARRRAAGALAALQRAGHHAVASRSWSTSC